MKKITVNGHVDWRIIIVGMVCITIIELYALSKGINGLISTSVIGTIALAIGVAVPKEKVIK